MKDPGSGWDFFWSGGCDRDRGLVGARPRYEGSDGRKPGPKGSPKPKHSLNLW